MPSRYSICSINCFILSIRLSSFSSGQAVAYPSNTAERSLNQPNEYLSFMVTNLWFYTLVELPYLTYPIHMPRSLTQSNKNMVKNTCIYKLLMKVSSVFMIVLTLDQPDLYGIYMWLFCLFFSYSQPTSKKCGV